MHIETYTSKLGDKAWEGKLCGFSQGSRACRIYSASKGIEVESLNVTFLEAPPSSMPSVGVDYSIDQDYENDVIDTTSSMDFTISDTQEEGTSAALERLQERISSMAHDIDRQERESHWRQHRRKERHHPPGRQRPKIPESILLHLGSCLLGDHSHSLGWRVHTQEPIPTPMTLATAHLRPSNCSTVAHHQLFLC